MIDTIKTLEDWILSKLPFQDFCEIGDEVDESIVEYFAEGKDWSKAKKLRSKTPVIVKEQPLYETFVKVQKHWFFAGLTKGNKKSPAE